MTDTWCPKIIYQCCAARVVTGAKKFDHVSPILKADFQSVEFSERAEIPLFVGENVAVKLNR